MGRLTHFKFEVKPTMYPVTVDGDKSELSVYEITVEIDGWPFTITREFPNFHPWESEIEYWIKAAHQKFKEQVYEEHISKENE